MAPPSPRNEHSIVGIEPCLRPAGRAAVTRIQFGARRHAQAYIQLGAGNYVSAKSRDLHALIASQPRLDLARSLLIRAFVAKGDVHAAMEQLPMRINEKANLVDAGFVYAHAGQRTSALAEIARIERLGNTGDFGVGYDIAIIQAALGGQAGGLRSARTCAR
jgi:hypothetical protein